MSLRTLAEIDADIDRCNWLREHLHDLSAVLEQDTALARLQAERDVAVSQGVAA
jgi:hypothetical protein